MSVQFPVRTQNVQLITHYWVVHEVAYGIIRILGGSMSTPFHGDPLSTKFNGADDDWRAARSLRPTRDELYQTVGSHFPLPHTASNVISFEKREKALAAQRCQKRIWSKLEPVTPTVREEFEQLT